MNSDTRNAALLRARDNTRTAAQWLVLLRHRNHPRAPEFSVWISTYHDMLDPAAPDESRVAACRRLHAAVSGSAEAERCTAQAFLVDHQDPDPYEACRGTTLRGAVLEMIAGLLDAALQEFSAAGISVDL